MQRQTRSAFSMVELLMVIGIIGFLATMLLVALAASKARSRQANCVSNLHQIGLGFTSFALDHEGKYPMDVPERLGGSMEFNRRQVITNTEFSRASQHFLALSNDLPNPKIMVCPADRRRAAVDNYRNFSGANLSYWAHTAASPHATLSALAGDWNIRNEASDPTDSAAPEMLEFGREVHGRKGSVLFADGRVEITRTLAYQRAVAPENPVAAPTPPPAERPLRFPAPTRNAPPANSRGPANVAPQPGRGVGANPDPVAPGGELLDPNIPVGTVSVPLPAPAVPFTNTYIHPTNKPVLSQEAYFRKVDYPEVHRVGESTSEETEKARTANPSPTIAPMRPAPPAAVEEPWNTPTFRALKMAIAGGYFLSLLWALLALLALCVRARMKRKQRQNSNPLPDFVETAPGG